METIQGFADWMAALPPGWIYAVVLAISYGENVIPPVPGDVAVVVAGSLVGLGLVAPVPTFVMAVVGSTMGFLTMYALGRRLGDAVHDPRRLRWIPRQPVRTVDRWFDRWGLAVVAVNRFLAGGRAVIALLAGSARLPAGPVALWATVSSALWCSLLVGGGYAVGSEWESVLRVLRTYGRIVSVLVGTVALGLGVRLYVRWRERRQAEPRPVVRRRRWPQRRARRQETEKTPPGGSNETGPR